MFAPLRFQNPVRKTWVSDYWKIIRLAEFRDTAPLKCKIKKKTECRVGTTVKG